MFLMSGLLAFVFYLYRQQLALVGRLLGVASHALVDNPSIVGGSLLLQVGGEVAMGGSRSSSGLVTQARKHNMSMVTHFVLVCAKVGDVVAGL